MRKLIEYALPLAVLDREASREKSIRHGHPSTLHLWWSRKPLAAARCVLFAQLVDDPGDRPDLYPTAEEQHAARSRLLDLCARLAPWEVTAGSPALDEAREVLREQYGSALPTAYDPFSGGGSIPLEAQRLGLPVVGADLNPVAALLTLALVEVPGRHVPTDALAADIRRYGRQVLERAAETAAEWYPTVRVDRRRAGPGRVPVGPHLHLRRVWGDRADAEQPVAGPQVRARGVARGQRARRRVRVRGHARGRAAWKAEGPGAGLRLPGLRDRDERTGRAGRGA